MPRARVFSTYADREATKSPRARRPGLRLRVLLALLCARPQLLQLPGRALVVLPRLGATNRRVERAATVAFSRLFVQSPCCKTRGPRQPHYTRRLSFLGRFGRFGLGGWLFEVLGFETAYQTATRQTSPIAEASPKIAIGVSLHCASVRIDSARRESYQQRSTTTKTQAQRGAATKVAS